MLEKNLHGAKEAGLFDEEGEKQGYTEKAKRCKADCL